MCKYAIKQGTTFKYRKKIREKEDQIDEAIKQQTEIVMALKRIKTIKPTQYNVDKWNHQSKILNEMFDIRAEHSGDRFVRSLDKNKNAIYRPINEQNRGQIRCLDNEKGERITNPKGVGDILADHLSNKVFKKSDASKTREKIKKRTGGQNNRREKNKIKRFRIDEKLVAEAIKEIKPTKSTDANGISNEFIIKTKNIITKFITVIGKLSFNSGVIPECLKRIVVVPIPKKSKANKPSNVRPINLCSNIVKIWERVAKKQIEELLKDTKFFNLAQHGFRNSRSTITCLAKINHKLEELLDEGAYMVCLDFAKAFDTVDHEVLIEEMGKAGIEYTALTWMSNWILGDMFQCRIGETLSEQKEITSGCKQGSCLGPLAFIVFINSLLNRLPNNVTFCYADDLTIIIPFGKPKPNKDMGNGNKNQETTQKYLDICTNWSNETGLKFNTDKCYLITIGTRWKPVEEFRLMNKIITVPNKEEEVTVLGVKFKGGKKDFLLAAKEDAKQSGGLVYKRLNALYRPTKFRHMKELYHVYFVSKSLYGSEIMEDYTWQNGQYTKRDRWTRKLDHYYKGLFKSRPPTLNDLKKGKKKRFTENYELDAIPFMPSQICLIKTLTFVFQIISGQLEDSDITIEQMSTSKEVTSQKFTRSQSMTKLSRELGENNSKVKSIIKRHNGIIKEIMSSEKFSKITIVKPSKQKHIIKQFVSNMNSEENEIRLQISKRNYKFTKEERQRMAKWKVSGVKKHKVRL